MKPMVLMVGADKGGVGKTTIARTLLDYLAAKNTLARAFDSEFPRGTLKRFHPGVTEIVNITTAADQIKILDTLTTSQIKVSIIDIRAGLLSSTLKAFTDVGLFDLVRAGEFNFGLFHVVGPSVSSLDEIGHVIPYVGGKHYFVVKNFVNETSFFEWNPTIYKNYFKMVKNAAELTIPKLNEMAYEQVELSGVPFATFVADKTMQGQPGNYSLVLRGYVRTWLNQIYGEYDRELVGRGPQFGHHLARLLDSTPPSYGTARRTPGQPGNSPRTERLYFGIERASQPAVVLSLTP